MTRSTALQLAPRAPRFSHVVLVSLYELGRQPFGLASAAVWLRDAGAHVHLVDLQKDPLPEETIAAADLIAFHLPMHTATRLAARVVPRVRSLNERATLCCFGLYAPLNEAWLKSLGATVILGPEFEPALAHLVATGLADEPPSDTIHPSSNRTAHRRTRVPRFRFRLPDRSGLPPLSRYAVLKMGPADERLAGYTESSRGCKHECRHCPIVPVYDGQFRIVQQDVVLEDIAQQVDAGAAHITFGDPDFFNGIRHACRVVSHLHARWPDLTYDVTIKIEHLIQHTTQLPLLRDTGCLFITSAVESIDDRVLALLAKGHSKRDFEKAVRLCRELGLSLVPTFVAFTPWTTMEGYRELLSVLAAMDLVDVVSSIQLALRLLIPQGSRLLQLPEILEVVDRYDSGSLVHVWRHPDPRVDRLEQGVRHLIDEGSRAGQSRREIFSAVWEQAHADAGRAIPRLPSSVLASRATIPYLNEPWYC